MPADRPGSGYGTEALRGIHPGPPHIPSRGFPSGRAIGAAPGSAPRNAAGMSLVVREWTEPGPSYLHIHRADDEAWHVLEGSLRFRFLDSMIDAGAGTTVFVPAGVAHTYSTLAPSRYLIFLTPRLDRLIATLRELRDASLLRATLEEFDTVLAE